MKREDLKKRLSKEQKNEKNIGSKPAKNMT